jgi:hypothetical protein
MPRRSPEDMHAAQMEALAGHKHAYIDGAVRLNMF